MNVMGSDKDHTGPDMDYKCFLHIAMYGTVEEYTDAVKKRKRDHCEGASASQQPHCLERQPHESNSAAKSGTQFPDTGGNKSPPINVAKLTEAEKAWFDKAHGCEESVVVEEAEE